ncbi:hypothetical protein [Streptacidiphilus jiangxiensis]|uniref:Uncharacterized protein n=1 Tax=Streptacidiphilus jiangxiensis TaxID=235985 RepID=A0A1H7JK43_STRJI|nr:hypothetical protein [Streptacidiphilus jiangxiensis]SEK74951.1 hypothetical protein SAMN05414137_103334 [Streptacidiphilus jiangxiensis]
MSRRIRVVIVSAILAAAAVAGVGAQDLGWTAVKSSTVADLGWTAAHGQALADLGWTRTPVAP